MKSFKCNSIIGPTGIFLALGLASAASAEHTVDGVITSPAVVASSISVPYSLADLTSNEGRETLFRQIRHAAKNVCGPTGLRAAGSLSVMTRNRKCYEETVNAAVSQVESAQFTAMLD